MITEARTPLRLTIRVALLWEMAMANKIGMIETFPDRDSVSGRLELVIRRTPIYISRRSERVIVGDTVVAWLPPEPDHQPDGYSEVRELQWNGDSITPATARELLGAAKEAKEPPPEMLEFLAMLNGLIPDA